MSNCMPRLTVAVAAWILAGVIVASAQNGQMSLAKDVTVTGDRLETETNGWFHAAGNVFVIYSDHQLRADKVDLNKTTGQVHARGHIELFRGEQGRWTGDVLDYNYLTKEGMTGSSEVRASKFTALAAETHVESNGMKRLLHARLTTCCNTNAADWHYWLAASEIDVREHDRATLYNSVPYFLGVPFFYLPYATRDLNHPLGPRILPGYKSSWGPYLLTTYAYPIYTPSGPEPDSVIGNVLLDYRALRGVAYGHELDWTHEELGTGHLGFYLTHDERPDSTLDESNPMPIDPNRYRIYLHHEANPTPNDQVLVQADGLSDERMMEDYFPPLYRAQSQPDNFFDYTHRGLTYAAGVGASGPLNEFYNGVGRVPEGWLKIMPQELFDNSGLLYESDSSAGYFVQQWTNDGTLTNVFEPDTVRIHSNQKLTYPFQAFDAINIVPRAAYDYTFYSHLADNRTNETRSVFELGTEASVKWYATYGEYRHVFEPYLDYALIMTPLNVKHGENYFFDRVDGPRDWGDQFGLDGNYEPERWNGVRPGMRNSILTKDADGNTRTVFDWDVFVAYRFGGNGGDTNGLRMAGWDMTWRPDRDLKFRTDGMYDTKEGRMDMSDSSVTFGEGRDWTFELGYFTSDPVDPAALNLPADPQLIGYNYLRPSELARASATHRFNSYWSANLFMRYDVKGTQLDEVGGYIQYDLDCLAFRLTSGYMPAYNYYDGTRRTADYSVSFLVIVKAFQPTYVDKMRGW